MNIIIETDRLILRKFLATDVEGIFKLDSNPNVHTYLGKKPINTYKEAEDVVAYIIQQYKNYNLGRLAILDKKTNDFIGWAGLKYETNVRKEFSYFDIGYRLREEYWGQGIGTEAARACLNYGFNKLKLEEISGAASLDNIGSNKILSKIGLRLKEQFKFDNELHNWYTLTLEDWLKKR